MRTKLIAQTRPTKYVNDPMGAVTKDPKWFRVLSFIVFAVAFVTIALNYGKQDPGYINEAEVGAK